MHRELYGWRRGCGYGQERLPRRLAVLPGLSRAGGLQRDKHQRVVSPTWHLPCRCPHSIWRSCEYTCISRWQSRMLTWSSDSGLTWWTFAVSHFPVFISLSQQHPNLEGITTGCNLEGQVGGIQSGCPVRPPAKHGTQSALGQLATHLSRETEPETTEFTFTGFSSLWLNFFALRSGNSWSCLQTCCQPVSKFTSLSSCQFYDFQFLSNRFLCQLLLPTTKGS